MQPPTMYTHLLYVRQKCSITLIGILFLVMVSTKIYAQPVDIAATKETLHLYQFLQKTLYLGILFGHQDDLAYGVNWKYVDGNSDVQSAVGAYPAVYGWELGRIENDATNNIDGVPFAKMRQYIQTAYERGGIITISWHLNNPLTGKTAWDPFPGTVASILPGGEKNAVYNSWLDKVANFLQSLTGKYGEVIPVIFRPFHELNGNWFWWGKAHCTPDEMIRLYRYTEHYLKDVKNIHNLLYAFNTDQFANLNEYEERYPGNAFVDIVGFDIYQRDNSGKAFVHNIGRMLTDLDAFAATHKKIPALTEFGFNEIPDKNWWTTVFAAGLKGHQVAYVLGWRNAGAKADGSIEYYVPFQGEASQPDFQKMKKSGLFIFQDKLSFSKVYQ